MGTPVVSERERVVDPEPEKSHFGRVLRDPTTQGGFAGVWADEEAGGEVHRPLPPSGWDELPPWHGGSDPDVRPADGSQVDDDIQVIPAPVCCRYDRRAGNSSHGQTPHWDSRHEPVRDSHDG